MRVENLTVVNEPEVQEPRITLRNCDDVQLSNVTIIGLREGREAVASPNSTNVKIEGLKRQSVQSDP